MPSRTLSIIALLATVFIWGTTFVVTKLALQGFAPLTLSLLRFALALVLLIPLAARAAEPQRGALPWRHLAVLGLVGGTLYFGTQNVGLGYTTAAKASLILASIPALTALAARFVLKEKVTYVRLFSALVSAGGVAFILLAERQADLGGGTLLGDLLIVGAALSWTAYTLIGKSVEGQVSPVLVTAATVGFGALFLVPAAAIEVVTQPVLVPDGLAWASLFYLSLVASALPFYLWNYALKALSASEASAYVNLVPVVAIVSGVAILHETVSTSQLVGGLIVVAGVWMAGSPQVERALAHVASGRGATRTSARD